MVELTKEILLESKLSEVSGNSQNDVTRVFVFASKVKQTNGPIRRTVENSH